MVRVTVDRLLPQLVHDKPWSLMKEAYDEGVQEGHSDVMDNPKFYGLRT